MLLLSRSDHVGMVTYPEALKRDLAQTPAPFLLPEERHEAPEDVNPERRSVMAPPAGAERSRDQRSRRVRIVRPTTRRSSEGG
jgi:hypothetical protein